MAGLKTASMDFSLCRTEADVAGLLGFVLDALMNRKVQ